MTTDKTVKNFLYRMINIQTETCIEQQVHSILLQAYRCVWCIEIYYISLRVIYIYIYMDI